MKTVAVLLARGGSKGILRKNLISIDGRPLFTFAMEAAIKAGLETWVSTDDDEIAEEAKRWGGKVLMRPSELAEDESPSEGALLHFAKNVEFDRIVFIQPTSPLLRANDIKEGLKMMNEYDSVFSGYEEHWYPRWTHSKLFKSFFEVNFQRGDRPRRQDKVPLIVENGAFYITTKRRLIESGCRYSGAVGCYIMPFSKSFQVDTYDDLRIIEALLEQYK